MQQDPSNMRWLTMCGHIIGLVIVLCLFGLSTVAGLLIVAALKWSWRLATH